MHTLVLNASYEPLAVVSVRRAVVLVLTEKAVAEHVDKMHAVCVVCGAPAHYSQRFAGGAEQVPHRRFRR